MPDNEDYLDFIKDKEGFIPEAQWDISQFSIGYGTRTNNANEVITEEEANNRLKEWTTNDREYINKAGAAKGVEWSSNELDALTSFTYNLGRGNLDTLIKDRSKEEIADKMNLYIKADGKDNKGLINRRASESELFRGTTPEALTIEPTAATSSEIQVQEGSDVDRSYLDFTERNIPLSVLRAEPENLEGSASIKDIWQAATQRHWIANSESRNLEAERGYDPSYSVKTEDLIKYNDAGYSDEEIKFLSSSTSNDNFTHRVERIQTDRNVKTLIEKEGMRGTGVEMLASMLDPTLIPTIFLGGTVAAAGKWNSAKAIGLSLMNGASQNLAAEYILKMGDTQRTDEDLMIAMAAGAIFSSGITSIGLGVRSLKGTRALTQANELDAIHKDAISSMMEGKVYMDADGILKKEIPNPVERKTSMSEKDIVSKLQEETGTRADTISSKKIKSAKKDFIEYRKAKELLISGIEASLIRPTAKIKQIKQLTDAIALRKNRLDEVVSDNNLVLQKNAELDNLQQGRIPDSLKDRYLELKKEGGEFDGVESSSLGDSLPKPKVVEGDATSTQPDAEIRDDSAGAMRVTRQFNDIETHDELLTPTEVDAIYEAVSIAEQLGLQVPRISRMASKAKGFRSTSTLIDNAPDAATRGMGIQLLKNGTRTIEGHQSAEELAETLFFRNVPDYLSHEASFDAYADSMGIGILGRGRGSLKEEFEKLVVLEQSSGRIVDNLADEADTPIVQAAKSRSRIYERSLKNNKDYGVIGFDNVEHTHQYHSVVYSPEMILSSGAHADNIVDTIANSYMTGGIKLTRANALRLANTQLERSFAFRNGGNGTFKSAMSDAEFNLLAKEMKEKGVDSTTIAELKDSLFNKEDLANMSPRAMFSLKPNLSATSGSLRMVDLVDTSMARVMKYASDSGANAGLASHGYKSRTQFLRAMAEARTSSINELRIDAKSPNPKIAANAERELAIAEKGTNHKYMDDALKLMYREPLEGSASDGLHDLSKILRKQTSITRLRSTGLMAIPENAIAMARNGALNTIRNLPLARYFDLRESSIVKDKFMADFARTFSATGHQEYLFGSKFYNNSEFDDMTKSKIGNMINKIQGKAMNVTMTVNAFRTFQHGGEEMVARSIVSNLKELSIKGEITPNIRKSLIKVGGLSEDQVNEMIAHFKERPNIDVFDSVRQMPPELYNAVSVAARNTIGSSFMRMGIGESVPYSNHELGKIMTQLLHFSIGSWEKMVVRGIKSDGAGLMASMFAGQAALALMSQYAYVYTRAAGMEGKKRDDFIDKQTSDEGLFWGTFNRVGFLAAPTIPLQMLASARMLPESISSSPTKAGISESGVPSISMAADAFNAIGGTAALISNTFDDKYMSNKDREKNWKNIRKVMPWIDSPLYNFTVGQVD